MMSQRSTVVVMTHVVMIEEVMTLATWVSVLSPTLLRPYGLLGSDLIEKFKPSQSARL